MSNPGDADTTPITSVRQLADYIAAGCKPRERIPHRHRTREVRLPPSRPDAAALRAGGRPSGRSAICWKAARGGSGEPILDHGNPIGLSRAMRRSRWNRPGSSSCRARRSTRCTRPAPNSKRTTPRCAPSPATLRHRLRAARLPPDWRRASDAVDAEGPLRHHAPLHAEGRLARPRHDDAHLHRAGQPGLRIRADMVRKLRVSLLLQPLATALFANSPFTEGRPNGFLSYRAHVWTDTDTHRTGIPRGVLRARLRFRALCRVADRRGADVLRLSRRPIYRSGRADRSAASWPGSLHN